MYLLDTNVVSGLRRRDRADRSLLSWADHQSPFLMFLSAIVIEELERGIHLLTRRDPRQSHVFRLWMDQFVLTHYDGRILPVDTPVAQLAGSLHVPRSMPYSDAFLAATALHHNLIMVTRNVRDFAGTGVRVLNPFEASPRSILP